MASRKKRPCLSEKTTQLLLDTSEYMDTIRGIYIYNDGMSSGSMNRTRDSHINSLGCGSNQNKYIRLSPFCTVFPFHRDNMSKRALGI